MVRFSAHAIARFQQRVRPALDELAAARELHRIAAVATVQQEPPDWYEPGEPTDAFLMLGDDACLVLQRISGGYIAMTCVVRGTLAPAARRRRNQNRSARTYRVTHKPPPLGRRPPQHDTDTRGRLIA